MSPHPIPVATLATATLLALTTLGVATATAQTPTTTTDRIEFLELLPAGASAVSFDHHRMWGLIPPPPYTTHPRHGVRFYLPPNALWGALYFGHTDPNQHVPNSTQLRLRTSHEVELPQATFHQPFIDVYFPGEELATATFTAQWLVMMPQNQQFRLTLSDGILFTIWR